jgi:hypothetical protein
MRAAERIGARPQIRLSELSVFKLPPKRRIMAVITGYFDDSRSGEKELWTIAGYVGDDDCWKRFEAEWPKVLVKHGVPWLHMKDMCKEHGIYSKWHPVEEHEAERKAFFQDIARTIGFCVLDGFYSSVRENDLKRFNKEYKMSLKPLPLAIYTVLLQIGRTYPNQNVEVIFDWADKLRSKIDTAETYAESDKRNVGIIDKTITTILCKQIWFKDVIEIQAADFLAYEIRKHHLDLNEWFGNEHLTDLSR